MRVSPILLDTYTRTHDKNARLPVLLRTTLLYTHSRKRQRAGEAKKQSHKHGVRRLTTSGLVSLGRVRRSGRVKLRYTCFAAREVKGSYRQRTRGSIDTVSGRSSSSFSYRTVTFFLRRLIRSYLFLTQRARFV